MQRATYKTGQSLVEFALIVPLLVAVLFGIIQLGLIFSLYISLTNSAREAARAGAIYQPVGDAPLSTDPLSSTVTLFDNQRQQYLSTVISDTLHPIVDSTALTVTVSYTPTLPLATNPYRAGDTVAVQLEHNYPLFFGMLGSWDIVIRSRSAMRIEPGGAVPAATTTSGGTP